jgi:hypothetical protein
MVGVTFLVIDYTNIGPCHSLPIEVIIRITVIRGLNSTANKSQTTLIPNQYLDNIMFQFVSRYCILVAFTFGVGLVDMIGVSGAPTARAAKCGTNNYGPFKLYAKTTEVDGAAEFLPLKLITEPFSGPTDHTDYILSVRFFFSSPVS